MDDFRCAGLDIKHDKYICLQPSPRLYIHDIAVVATVASVAIIVMVKPNETRFKQVF